MDKLKAKLKKQGGFTLVEMLIVVAIIAILVAISIPLINNALEKARKATDDANERAAKAEAAIVYLTNEDAWVKTAYVYNAPDGKLQTGAFNSASGKGYGKSTSNVNKVIQAVIDTDGSIDISWIDSNAEPSAD